MQENAPVFSLIATLSPSEKRHFRIFAARHVIGEGNQYLELFDAIVAHDAQGDQAFLDQPAFARFTRNFTYNAHYLYQLILRSLQAYSYESTPSRRLRSLLDKMELLMDRQLLDLAEKLYRKVVKEAESIEDFTVILQALQIKRQWMRKQGEKQIWKELPALHDKVSQVVQQMANENDLLRCYAEVFLATQNKLSFGPSENAALNAILANPLLQDESHAITFNSRIAWHFIHAFTHTLRNRHVLAKPHYAKILEVWQRHPRQIELHVERYAMSIIDLLNCGHLQDDYSDFEAGLLAIRALRNLPSAVALRIHWMTTNLEVLYYLNTVRLELAADAVARWEQVLAQNEDRVSAASILSYAFNICLLYFVKEDFSAALRWVNRILNHPRTQARSDVQRFARLFYIVLQIELGNLLMLETELASARRSLQQLGINAFERATVALLGKLIAQPRTAWRGLLGRYQAKLQELAQAGSPFFGLQEMQMWVASRSAGHSLADELRRMLGHPIG